MAEDSSQKTEDPSQRKLDKAYESGDVPNSKEVQSFSIILFFTIVIAWGGLSLVNSATSFLAESLSLISENAENSYKNAFRVFIFALLLVFIIALIASTISASVQHGIRFSTKSIKFSFSRVSILQGAKRIFSLNSVIELFKSIVKFLLLSLALYLTAKEEIYKLTSAITIESLINSIGVITKKVFITASIILGGIAVLDFLYQKFSYIKRMKMSKQEVKDEYKQSEGSPQTKSRLSNLRNRFLRKRMMAAVPQANVIITNPTHYAVALQYDIDTMEAPKVIAKGVDYIALEIRSIAKKHGIRIVSNPELARALYKEVEIDSFINYKHYALVAEIIASVMKISNRLDRVRQ